MSSVISYCCSFVIYKKYITNVLLSHGNINSLWIMIYFIHAMHYKNVIMNAMTSQITSLTIVYSTVYSRRRSKKISKLRVTGICAGNSPVTGEFPAQRASNAGNVSIWSSSWDTLESNDTDNIYRVQCRFSAVNFRNNPCSVHPIARSWGQGQIWSVYCELLWVESLIYVLLQSLQCCMQYRIILDGVIAAPDRIYLNVWLPWVEVRVNSQRICIVQVTAVYNLWAN